MLQSFCLTLGSPVRSTELDLILLCAVQFEIFHGKKMPHHMTATQERMIGD